MIEGLLQTQLLEQLDLLEGFFAEIMAENKVELMEFAGVVSVYLQVEKFYYVEFWSFQISQDYLINRLTSSFIRFLKFLKSFHRVLFSCKELMIMQTQTGIRTAVDRSLFSSLEELENEIALPLGDLRAFVEYFYVSYNNIKRTFSKSSLLYERDRVIFDKLLLYIDKFLHKSMDTINQEAKTLYGDVERVLQENIVKNNKSSLKALKEWQEEMKIYDTMKKNVDEDALLDFNQGKHSFI